MLFHNEMDDDQKWQRHPKLEQSDDVVVDDVVTDVDVDGERVIVNGRWKLVEEVAAQIGE